MAAHSTPEMMLDSNEKPARSVCDVEFECRHKIMNDQKGRYKVWYFVNKKKYEEIKITGNSCHKSRHEFDTITVMDEIDGWRDTRLGYVMFVRPDVVLVSSICWLVSISMLPWLSNISYSGWIWHNHLPVLFVSCIIYNKASSLPQLRWEGGWPNFIIYFVYINSTFLTSMLFCQMITLYDGVNICTVLFFLASVIVQHTTLHLLISDPGNKWL
jgi:hypothetical protein